jgi:hypothetical protein
LRSRRLAPTLVKKLIVKSSQSERRIPVRRRRPILIALPALCLLPMYIDSRPVGGVGHVRITCDFGAGPISIRPCSADHRYDSHDMRLRILELQDAMPAKVGDLTYFKSRPRLRIGGSGSHPPSSRPLLVTLKAFVVTACRQELLSGYISSRCCRNASDKPPRRRRNRQYRQVN